MNESGNERKVAWRRVKTSKNERKKKEISKWRNIESVWHHIERKSKSMAMAKSAKANNNGVIMAMASNSENRIGENDQ
jgi:hypothetical protein